MNRFALVLLGAALAGCGSKTISQCSADSDCNIVYPFCDVEGAFPPSGGAKNVCTIIPPGCPVDRCGCSPGATTCAGDQQTTCNADGKGTTTDACALGCSTTQDRCLGFKPLNGLGPALTAAAAEPPVVIPPGSTIDTDTGYIRDSAFTKLNVSTVVVTGATDIRVFLGGSFDISNVVITGTKAVAFVSPGAVTIRGMIDASANKNVSGPGASTTGCVGEVATDSNSNTLGGGGGHVTKGGDGFSSQPDLQHGGDIILRAPGGAPVTGSSLVGGCIGGGGAGAGGGGGAVQIDSLTKIEFPNTKLGFIDVGGGGARQASSRSSGGGAGGLVVLEAPEIVLGNVTANGGSGASCLLDGMDATPNQVVADAGLSMCAGNAPRSHGGSGGTVDSAPGGGGGYYGGGGGAAVGVLFVNTLDGTHASVAGSILSASVIPGTISPI